MSSMRQKICPFSFLFSTFFTMDYDITYGDVLGEVVRRQIETVNKQKRVFCDVIKVIYLVCRKI